MTSASKIAANRRNAAKSTGPRSAAAKHRTRRNAVRHGLTARMVLDPDHLLRIDAMARELVGGKRDFTSLEFAHAVARAECDLDRIRQQKTALINAAAASMIAAKASAQASAGFESAAMVQVLPELIKIERYETQVLARRNRALDALLETSR